MSRSDVDEAFYRLTIAQRDLAWREIEVKETEVSAADARTAAQTARLKAVEVCLASLAHQSEAEWGDESPPWLDQAIARIEEAIGGISPRLLGHEGPDAGAINDLKVIAGRMRECLESGSPVRLQEWLMTIDSALTRLEDS